MSEPVYSRITEAEEMIKAICEKEPKMFWRVRPQMVAVYGNETKERPDNCKEDAVIKCVKGVEKAIMQDNHIPTRYHIKLYWSDWRKWQPNEKQGALIPQLLRIHEEVGKLIKPDIEGFRILLDKTGVKEDNLKNFPDVINGKGEFDLSLLPKTEEADEEENDEINEEIEKKKRGRPKKEAKEEVVEPKEEKKDAPKDGDIF